MKGRFVASMFGMLTLAGCATQGKSTMDISTHPPANVGNEIVVSEPYSQVWDKLVKELSKSYYVINNIDKESRIINISFSSPTPQEYVDCGNTSRTYTRGNNTQSFNYDIAASSTYRMATTNKQEPQLAYYADVRRTTNLEGRSNVYLAPEETDKNKTRVAVNTRYVLSITISGQFYAENFAGQIVRTAPMPTEPARLIAFNTNKPIQQDMGGEVVTCFGNGKLEQNILGLLTH